MDTPKKPSEGRVVIKTEAHKEAMRSLLKRKEKTAKLLKKNASKPTTDIAAIPEKVEKIEQVREKIGAAIDVHFWQPILRPLAKYQHWERKKLEASVIRAKIKSLVESDGYQKLDEWVLTYGSVFGPDAAKYIARLAHANPNSGLLKSIFMVTQIGFGIGFAMDTALHSIVKGTGYWFNVVDDKTDEEGERKKFDWEPAPLINIAGIVGTALEVAIRTETEIDSENLRIARVVKTTRMARIGKALRLTKSIKSNNSIEDEGVGKILEDFSRRLTIIIASMIGLSIDSVPVNLISMGIMVQSIKGFMKDVRVDFWEVVIRRLNEIENQFIERVKNNPFIGHMAGNIDQSKNELEHIGDRAYRFATATEELVNPQHENFTLDDEGKLSPKFVDATTAIVDIRNSSAIQNKYGIEIILSELADLFSELLILIEKHGQFSNFTGDGAVLYFKDKKNEEGVVTKSKQDKAVEFAFDLAVFSDKWDKKLREDFPLENEEENNHKITMGISSGPIAIADVFSHRTDKSGRTIKIRKAETIGNTVNTTARVESANKTFPGHIILMSNADYKKLSPTYQRLCVECGTTHLKGIGDVKIWGIPEGATSK